MRWRRELTQAEHLAIEPLRARLATARHRHLDVFEAQDHARLLRHARSPPHVTEFVVPRACARYTARAAPPAPGPPPRAARPASQRSGPLCRMRWRPMQSHQYQCSAPHAIIPATSADTRYRKWRCEKDWRDEPRPARNLRPGRAHAQLLARGGIARPRAANAERAHRGARGGAGHAPVRAPRPHPPA